MRIQVNGPLITKGSTAWGKKEPYENSQDAIRTSIESHPERDQLKVWFEARKKLSLIAEFYLCHQRVHQTDLDNLLCNLFNPLVEGVCGCRPSGKPIPQNNDSLFWQVHAVKIEDANERTVLVIEPLW